VARSRTLRADAGVGALVADETAVEGGQVAFGVAADLELELDGMALGVDAQ
jgi:hypothetical protein